MSVSVKTHQSVLAKFHQGKSIKIHVLTPVNQIVATIAPNDKRGMAQNE